MRNPEETVRTQVTIRRRHRRWLKLVARLATWRIQEDPVYVDPETDDATNVSMTEVLRNVLDGKMWGQSKYLHYRVRPEGVPEFTEGAFHPPGDYVPTKKAVRENGGEHLGADGRRMEILQAQVDVSAYAKTMDPTADIREIPDGRKGREGSLLSS